MTIAVLLTTFNRKDKTVTCLENLDRQRLPEDVKLELFITDDASSDGTQEAIRERFPEARLYHGSGSLYWAGGMRNSWKKAQLTNPDYYLLLNDDTILYDHAIEVLLQYSCKVLGTASLPCICIGSTVNAETGIISYGGRKLKSSATPFSEMVYSNTDYLDCDLGNANIMLVPKEIVNKIGVLSEGYTHGIADYDYTLKAKKAGFKVLVAPGYLGTCEDDHGKNWKSQNVNLSDRIKYLMSPKGLAYKEYLRFIRNHFPFHYPSAFCKLWLKTMFPFIWDIMKK